MEKFNFKRNKKSTSSFYGQSGYYCLKVFLCLFTGTSNYEVSVSVFAFYKFHNHFLCVFFWVIDLLRDFCVVSKIFYLKILICLFLMVLDEFQTSFSQTPWQLRRYFAAKECEELSSRFHP